MPTTASILRVMLASASLSGVVVEKQPLPVATSRSALADLLPVVPTAVRAFGAGDAATAFVRVYQGGSRAPAPVVVTARVTDAHDATRVTRTSRLPAEAFARTRSADFTWTLPTQELGPGEYADLEAFLDSGEPPVYFGFGSTRAPRDVSQVIVDTGRALGRRAVVSRGWADLSVVDGPDCMAIDDVNLHALFTRVAAVVHHGGAGTTTLAALAGTPQVAIPQVYDQHYWARRVEQLGLGSAHAPGPPTTGSLTSALDGPCNPPLPAARSRLQARCAPTVQSGPRDACWPATRPTAGDVPRSRLLVLRAGPSFLVHRARNGTVTRPWTNDQDPSADPARQASMEWKCSRTQPMSIASYLTPFSL